MCFQALGYETINAACICGAEQVNPKIQSTVDADALAHMTDRWAKYHMNVCGPPFWPAPGHRRTAPG